MGLLSDVMGPVWNFLCVGTNQHVHRSPFCGLYIWVTTCVLNACDTFELSSSGCVFTLLVYL